MLRAKFCLTSMQGGDQMDSFSMYVQNKNKAFKAQSSDNTLGQAKPLGDSPFSYIGQKHFIIVL